MRNVCGCCETDCGCDCNYCHECECDHEPWRLQDYLMPSDSSNGIQIGGWIQAGIRTNDRGNSTSVGNSPGGGFTSDADEFNQDRSCDPATGQVESAAKNHFRRSRQRPTDRSRLRKQIEAHRAPCSVRFGLPWERERAFENPIPQAAGQRPAAAFTGASATGKPAANGQQQPLQVPCRTRNAPPPPVDSQRATVA